MFASRRKIQVIFGILVTVTSFQIFSFIFFCCNDLHKVCLACKKGIPVAEFCRDNSRDYDCPISILLAVSLNQTTKGRTKFTAEVLTQYLKISGQDLILIDSQYGYSTETLRSWFDKRVKILTSLHDALQVFITSPHEVFLHIDSNTIMHDFWRTFIDNQILNEVENVSLSSYRISNDRGTLFDFILLGKDRARAVIEDKNVEAKTSSLLHRYKVKAPVVENFPFINLGSPDSRYECEPEISLSLDRCDFPSWIREGIEYFHKNCDDIDAEYTIKDHMPRTRPRGNTRIGILVVLSSSTTSKLFVQSFKKTINKKLNFTIYAVTNRNISEMWLNAYVPKNVNVKIFSSSGGSHIDMTNLLYSRAYEDKMDYFVQTKDSLLFQSHGWANNAIQIMKSKRPPNVGVVQTTCPDCETQRCVNFVSRLHFDIFGSFFPMEILDNETCDWISEVYKADPGWMVKSESASTVGLLSKDRLVKSLIHSRDVLQKWSRPVVAYSLYGSNPRYVGGAIANMKLMPIYFQGWQMWVYHDNTVPRPILQRLCENGVTLIDMSSSSVRNKMTWRFFVASEPVRRFIIRDVDSRLNKRDRYIVDEWLASGKKFHVIRDHLEHVKYPINGGMWGGTFDAFPEMKNYLEQNDPSTLYMADMNFLWNVVWKEAQKSVLQHDDTKYSEFGKTHSFPLPRDGNFVGKVYYDGE